MELRELDIVKLKDGTEGTIVYLPPKNLKTEHFLLDIGHDPTTWDTIDVKQSDIEKILYKAEQS